MKSTAEGRTLLEADEVARAIPKLSVLVEPGWLRSSSPEEVGEIVRRLIGEMHVMELRVTTHFVEIVVAVPAAERHVTDLDVLQASVQNHVNRILKEVHAAHLKRELHRPAADSTPCVPVMPRGEE